MRGSSCEILNSSGPNPSNDQVKRISRRELLDSDSGTPAEIAASLADLRRINCWFGGVSTTEHLLRQIARRCGTRSLSLLEVAAGAGDVPVILKRRLRSQGITLEITLLDRSPAHLRNGNSGVRGIVGDALHLPFADNSFDVVGSSLFVHHLPPLEVVAFVNEAIRVCRVAVLINDLIRDPLHLALVYAGMPLYRSRITRHDSVASVQQAYTVQEMADLVTGTEAAQVEIQSRYLYRMAVTAWKTRSAEDGPCTT